MVARLAADGAIVDAVDRDQAGVKQLADDVPGVEPVVCDRSDLDALDDTMDALPPVDVLQPRCRSSTPTVSP